MSKIVSTPSKLRAAPVSFAEVPKSPAYHSHTPRGLRAERFSGLWEYFHDDVVEEVDGRGEKISEGEDPEQPNLKNIRGFLLKKRKPGWHKRYFVLERGTLRYARNPAQMTKGKLLGSIDLGLAFIHCDRSTKRIDVDAEHQLYHLKTKNSSHFAAWSSCLVSHEMYRKALLAGAEGPTHTVEGRVAIAEGKGLEGWATEVKDHMTVIKRDLDSIRDNLEAVSIFVKSPANRPLSALSSASAGEPRGPESGSDTASLQSQQNGSEATTGAGGVGGGGGTKKRRGLGRKKHEKKLSKDFGTVYPEPPTVTSSSSLVEDAIAVDNTVIRDDFMNVARNVYSQFCDVAGKLDELQEGLQKALEHEALAKQELKSIVSSQQILLRQSLVQNNELRERLAQIQSLAAGADASQARTSSFLPTSRSTPSHKSLSRYDSFMSSGSAVSDKFFDAVAEMHEASSDSEEENTGTDAEDSLMEEEENEMDEIFSSVTAEALSSLNASANSPSHSALTKVPSITVDMVTDARSRDQVMRRRTKLPSPVIDVGDLSLWSLLRKNIGKDLSKISMPVTLNEPLSALQRLCEQLEFSELLNEAVGLSDPHERMVRVATFAVSFYALSYYRAGRKPFNPILGETYECVREDKGFRFIAEQVSHHPPIAACHCESPDFCFWLDTRIKNKFWGKSMEIFPIGTINVTFPKHGDHYQWSNVTSCIHNVLGGQRWVDQYGEMVITNQGKCSCKLNFVKAGYWSSRKYEVHGDVYNREGVKVESLFGTWNEAMFCGELENPICVWRIAPMPGDYERYYGFSQFAIELNEMEEGLEEKLPCTDCRFRTDQRLLEEGRVQEAEAEKHRVEQLQRAARAERERLGKEWEPNFFRKEQQGSQECWVTKGNYWTLRETGFSGINLPKLW